MWALNRRNWLGCYSKLWDDVFFIISKIWKSLIVSARRRVVARDYHTHVGTVQEHALNRFKKDSLASMASVFELLNVVEHDVEVLIESAKDSVVLLLVLHEDPHFVTKTLVHDLFKGLRCRNSLPKGSTWPTPIV